MKLKIELSENQLNTIVKSLDLYSRVLCGQIEEVPHVIQYADFDRVPDRHTVDIAVRKLKQALFPEIYPASYSICSEGKLQQKATVAYDTLQVLEILQEKRQEIFKTSKEELPIAVLEE